MKKLGKLSINAERLIKGNELIKLRGGDWPLNCDPGRMLKHCYCFDKPGEWWGCYSSEYQVAEALEAYCSAPPEPGGGYCMEGIGGY